MNLKSFSALTASVLILNPGTHAAVTQWHVVKGAEYAQTVDNTAPASTTNWVLYAELDTDLAGDAASVVLQGGNLPGPLPFVQDGSYWELNSIYPNKAALDAAAPSDGSYSIILSGGTLGTLTQQVAFAAEVYPNTPYLTGADFSRFQALETMEPFEVNWNSSGTNFNSITFEVSPGSPEADVLPIFEVVDDLGFTTSTNFPVDLFAVNSNYTGYLEFGLGTNISGSTGFGVDGTASFNKATVLPIHTVNTASGSDDFNDNSFDTAKWSLLSFELGKFFTEANQRLEFQSNATPDGDSVVWGWSNTLSYTQDWSVAVDIANLLDSGSMPTDGETYTGLGVFFGGFNRLASIELFKNEFATTLYTMATNEVSGIGDDFEIPISAVRVSVKIGFDATRKVLYSAYSTGGDYTLLGQYPIQDWGMTASSVFNLGFFAGTHLTAVTQGDIYLDNFRIYGTPAAFSNHIGYVELEYNRDYEFPDSTVGERGNWFKFDVTSSLFVDSVMIASPAGDVTNIPIDEVLGGTNYWYIEYKEPFPTPWNPVNDDDWMVTAAFENGTIRSTTIPFTKANGSAIPVINKQPLFTSQGGLDGFVTNASMLNVSFNTADPNALFVSIDEYPDNDDGEIRFYADSTATDVLGVIPAVHGPLSTTSDTIPVIQGTNWWLLTHSWGRSDTNADGIPFVVVKQTESDVIFIITADADSDNMDDSWEIQFFGSTNAVNGGAYDDFDMDGMVNLYEFISGSNPTNGGSVFRVDQALPVPAGFVVNWNSVAGRQYGIYWTTNLISGFQMLATGLLYPVNSYTDTVHTAEDGGFYSIDVQLDN